MNIYFLSLSIIFYILTSTALVLRATNRLPLKSDSKPEFWALGTLAVLMHGLLLYKGIFTRYGIDLEVFKALSMVGWIMAVSILVAAIRQPVQYLAIILFPLAVFVITLDFMLAPELGPALNGTKLLNKSARIASQPWQLKVHIFVSIIAYSILSIALIQSILLAIQDRLLHNHRPNGLIRLLPPLQVMENLFFKTVTIGFVLLTVGLVIGISFVKDIAAQHLIHKTVLSVIAWVLFGVLLWGHWQYGWRGKFAIRWAVAGFIALMLGFIGTKTVLELILNR